MVATLVAVAAVMATVILHGMDSHDDDVIVLHLLNFTTSWIC